jgi:hypothetical protein
VTDYDQNEKELARLRGLLERGGGCEPAGPANRP